MVNEDDILLVSGGFSMDASQNSLAEHVAHVVDGSDQPDDCIQLDDALDPRFRAGKGAHANGSARPHPQHAHLCAQGDPANDTEPVSNQPFAPALPNSSLQAHAQPFAPPTPYAPESVSQTMNHERHSRSNSYGSSSVGVGQPNDGHGGNSTGMQRMGGSQITEAVNAGGTSTAGNTQVPFGTIDENLPTGTGVLADSGAETGGLSFSGGLGGPHARVASIGGGLSARDASLSFGNLAMEGHNQPERDYSTELLLRDAMYPATHNAMFPSLKLPELSMDGGNTAYAPAQTGTDLSWSNSAMQAQAQSHQMAGLMQAGQLGGQMAGYSTLPPGAAAQFAPGMNVGGADSGVLDYAESTGAAGGSSFFERGYASHPRQEGTLRGWHTNSTPAMLGMEGGYSGNSGNAGSAISPRHLQTGPAWDQMPGVWRNDSGFHSNPGAVFDGSGPPMMPQGAMSGSFPNMLDNVDAGGNFSRESGAGMHSGNANIWLRGGSHPQLSTLGRGSGGGGYGSSMGGVGSMPKGGGGSFGGDLWKQRTNSAISLSQLQRATAAATGATSAAAAYAAAGSGSGSSGSRAPSEHPLGEYPSRTLFTRNINIHTTDEELLTIFSQCGEVRSMYTSCKHRGFVMISYYDIRASTRAKQVLQRALDIHYSVPKENAAEPDLNQGTLVVFNMDSSIPRNQILDLFSQFGEVKEIRATPKKEGHKFVEFYDSRHAHAALQGLNRVIVAGRQLKIELSRPGGVRRARNSQQNLVALHSENSSSQQDLLAASSLGSGNQPDNVPLAHSLPNTLGHGIGALVGATSSTGGGASSNGGATGASANGAMPGSNGGSLQGSAEIQAMFQNLMLQAANPNAQGGHQGQQSSQGGFGGGLSGPGGDSLQTPPETPAAEGSLPDASVAGGGNVGPQARSLGGQGGMSAMGNMSSGTGQMGSDSGMLSQQQQQPGSSLTGGMGINAPRSNPHSNTPSVAHSPAGGNLDESYAAACRAWGSTVTTGNAPGAGAGASYGSMQPFVPGRTSADQPHQGMGAGGAGQGGMHLPPGLMQHQGQPQHLSPSDSATSLHSFYNALLRQFAANPGSTNTSPEAMEGSYHSMLSELLQGSASNPAAAAAAAAAGFQQQPPAPFSGAPKPEQARSMHSTQPQSHINAPSFHPGGQPMQLNATGMEQPPQAGGPHPLHNSMTSNAPGSGGNSNGSGGTLPATLAAAAASAAAALARDPSIPPEEHESRLHQHLMEQLSNMHRHAVGQDLMMEQYKSQTTPPASPEQQPLPPHHASPQGASSSYHLTPPHPPGSIGSPHRSPHSSLPHSPRGPLPAPRGPHPLSMSQFTPSPPPAPPSVDSDLNSPGRGPGSVGSSSLRPMSPGGGLSLGGTNSHGRYGHGASTPRPISARHSRSPLAGGHSNASSLPASVAGSHNSVGEYLDGGSGSRRASHSGEHFILTPEAVGTGPGMDSRTTLMIRNIPNKYTQKILMQTIDAQGFYGKYDFFYLPIDFKNRCNVGYAFINMASTDAVRAIHEEFHNKGWERFNSEKKCCVAYARIQTRRALISHFQNSSLMHEDKRCRPVLLNLSGPSPEIEEFPPPRRASHSSHSRRGGARSSGRRESMDSQPASNRGSEPPTAPGTGNNTPRKSQETLPVSSGTPGRATS